MIKILDINKIDYRDLLEELIKIDYLTLDNLSISNEGNLEQWLKIFNKCCDNWKVFVSGDKIIGYWNYLSLTSESYRLVKEGKLLDGELTLENVRLIDKPGVYDIYFVYMGLLVGFRSLGNIRFLLRSVRENFIELEERGVIIREVVARTWSLEGRKLCKLFGLDYI